MGAGVTVETHASPVDDALDAVARAIDRLAALADPASELRVEGADAALVVIGSLAAAGRLSAIAARSVPVVEADGWWALRGARSITSWLAANGRVSHGQAARLVVLGRAFRDDLPATAVDAVAGSVSIEAAHVVATVTTTPMRKAALAASVADCGEGFLVEHARELTIGQLRILARRWAAHADPGADERGYRETSEREYLDLANTMDGWHLTGFLTTEHGHALNSALDAMAGRSADQAGQPAGRRRARALNNVVRTVLDRDLTGATGDHRPQITVVTDLATLSRALGGDPQGRRALGGDPQGRPRDGSAVVLADAATPEAAGALVLDHGGVPDVVSGRGASLADPSTRCPSAHQRGATRDTEAEEGVPRAGAPPADLGHTRVRAAGPDRRGAPPGPEATSTSESAPAGTSDVDRFAVAELVGTGPIPDSVLARLACDSQITRVVFGADSVVLNVGRAERTYTGAKRRAIVARDGGCRFPGCSAPPAMSEVHHTEHWLRDHGDTDVRTGVLVCWHHHQVIHDRGINVCRGPEGRWCFTDRRGRALTRSIG